VVGEAPSARLAPAMLDRTRPAVVLLDLRLADGSECDGLSLCATITQRYPDIRVLVRRLLRDVAEGREPGDVTTLRDATVLTQLGHNAAPDQPKEAP
jgi:CheY-like chemotaxis protein